MSNLSRREFMIMTASTVAATQMSHAATGNAAGKLTAGEVVDRIKANLGIPWNPKTFRDLFHIGGPEMRVNGIATSFGGNFRVLDLAQKAGLNMVIVHEPTFYSDADVVDWVKDDPMYKYKLNWANEHNIVVWRIHDHWHAHKPDGIQTGWDNASGWNKYLVEGTLTKWVLPPTTLGALAKYVAKTFSSQSIRVIGDPNLPVTKFARGGHLLAQNTAAIQDADAILISETTEYDTFEYMRDVVYTGAKKGAIITSHCTGEDEGMRYFAEWVQPLVPELKVQYIATTDEYWHV